jgi:hypothetical protein
MPARSREGSRPGGLDRHDGRSSGLRGGRILYFNIVTSRPRLRAPGSDLPAPGVGRGRILYFNIVTVR